MDRQHWINLAYKLCFWEEEQVHGSQINQITKSDQVCTLTRLPVYHTVSTNSGEKKNTPNRENKTKTKPIFPDFMFSVIEMKFKLQQ